MRNKKVKVKIAAMLAISAFPLPMIAATSEEADPCANFTEAVNIQGESEEENATENVTQGNQSNSPGNGNVTDMYNKKQNLGGDREK